MTTTNRLFNTLASHSLGVDNTFALIQSSIEVAAKGAANFDPLCLQAFNYMKECNAELESNLKVNPRTDFTQQLRVLNKECDQLFGALRRTVKYYAKDGDTTQRAAAKELTLFLDPYRRLAYMALNTQTAVLNELMGKYQASTALKNAAKALGIEGRMTSLQTVNQAFAQVYQQRNLATAQRRSTRTNSQLRSQSVQAYNRFCKILEQACLYTRDTEQSGIIEQLNGFRTKYQALVGRSKTAAAKQQPELTQAA